MKITRLYALALLLLPGMLLTAFLWPVSAQTPDTNPAVSIAETTFPLTKPIELNSYEVAPLTTVPAPEPATQLLIQASEQISPVAAITATSPLATKPENVLLTQLTATPAPLKQVPAATAYIDTQNNDSFAVSSAIYYAVDQGSTRIEIALDQQTVDPIVRTAVIYAASKGATVIDTALALRD